VAIDFSVYDDSRPGCVLILGHLIVICYSCRVDKYIAFSTDIYIASLNLAGIKIIIPKAQLLYNFELSITGPSQGYIRSDRDMK
jgi:hypothetical protein